MINVISLKLNEVCWLSKVKFELLSGQWVASSTYDLGDNICIIVNCTLKFLKEYYEM